MNPTQRKDLQKKLAHRFKDRDLLRAALTHPSARNENQDREESDNQRLEFLGDAVLGMQAAEELFHLEEDLDEGTMTRLRSRITSRPALASLGRTWELGDLLRFGRGEEESGGAERDSNLADAVEALIGAVFEDGGMKACRKLFRHTLLPLLENARSETRKNVHTGNPKGALQEWTQAQWQRSPDYRIVKESGPAHDRQYRAAVIWEGEEIAFGEGPSKRVAETAAAKAALPLFQSRRRARNSSTEGTSS